MTNILLPIIILVISGGIFFGPTRPLLNSLSDKQAKINDTRSAVAKIGDYRASFDIKNARFNTINQRDKDSLDAMVPSTIDNVGLIIDINQMAVKYNLSIKNISIKSGADNTVGPDGRPYGVVSLGFSISSSLKVFQDFIQELESSLRIIDVTSLSFTAGSEDQYDFSLEVKAYWLKDKQ